MSELYVIKHSGERELLDVSKATKSLQWATKDCDNVSTSDIEMSSKLHFYNDIPTSFILDVLIKTTYDMSETWNDYGKVCKNLMLQKLYKQVFKSTEPIPLSDHIYINSTSYGGNIHKYTEEELEYLDSKIKHERDFDFTASGLMKLGSSYGLKSVKETPQFMFMLIAMDAFYDYDKDYLEDVILMYTGLSTFKITLPTPEMQSLRTDRDS